MDPKSCRQTPLDYCHDLFPSSYFDFTIKPHLSFFSKCVFELNVSCFVDDCVNSREGQKQQHQGFIQL